MANLRHLRCAKRGGDGREEEANEEAEVMLPLSANQMASSPLSVFSLASSWSVNGGWLKDGSTLLVLVLGVMTSNFSKN